MKTADERDPMLVMLEQIRDIMKTNHIKVAFFNFKEPQGRWLFREVDRFPKPANTQ